MSTGIPDWSPPVEPEPDRRMADFVEGVVPDYFDARRIGFAAIEEMERTRAELELAHNAHADAEVAYRRARHTATMDARFTKIDGKRLTEIERKTWVDVATADLKVRQLAAWGTVESARAAVTIADRKNATVRQFNQWSRDIWARDAG